MWLQKDSASPLDGWSVKPILTLSNLQRTAKDDLNGLLYFYVRILLEEFCLRLQSPHCKTRFTLYCVDAADLPKTVTTQPSFSGFDKIEVSNIVDEGYLGLFGTLTLFPPLLKKPDVNPHAALITLFFNACEATDRMTGSDADQGVVAKRFHQVMKYMPPNPDDRRDAYSASQVRRIAAMALVRDYDKIFKHYAERVQMALYAATAGVRMREPNTIIEAWPMRVKKAPSEPGAKEEFEMLLASSCTGGERYVEWVLKEEQIESVD